MGAPSQRRRVRSPSQDSGIEQSPSVPAWRRMALRAIFVQNTVEAGNALMGLGVQAKAIVDTRFMRSLIRRTQEVDRMEIESLLEAIRAEEEELADWELAGRGRKYEESLT